MPGWERAHLTGELGLVLQPRRSHGGQVGTEEARAPGVRCQECHMRCRWRKEESRQVPRAPAAGRMVSTSVAERALSQWKSRPPLSRPLSLPPSPFHFLMFRRCERGHAAGLAPGESPRPCLGGWEVRHACKIPRLPSSRPLFSCVWNLPGPATLNSVRKRNR